MIMKKIPQSIVVSRPLYQRSRFRRIGVTDVADTKVMSEFLHREGGRYWTEIDGVRQLYRRIECKMCFEVIEKLRVL